MRCFFFGHDFRLVQDLSAIAQKVQCRRCERYYGLLISGDRREWNERLEDFYANKLELGPTWR